MANHNVGLNIDFETKQKVATLAALVCATGFGFLSLRMLLFNALLVAVIAGIIAIAVSFWRVGFGVVAILAGIGAFIAGIYYSPY